MKKDKPMSKTISKSTKNLLAAIAIAGLLITLVPSFLNWQGIIGPERVNTLMVWGTIIWFVPAIFLFGKKPETTDND